MKKKNKIDNDVNFCDEHSRLLDEPQFRIGDRVQRRNGCGWTPIGPIMIVKHIINENKVLCEWEDIINDTTQQDVFEINKLLRIL